MRPFIVACLLVCAVHAAEPETSSVTPKSTVADPKATAEWLASIITIRQNQVLIAGKPLENYAEARLPFSKATEVQIYRELSIIANQEGLYPMIISRDEDGYRFSMFTPLYPFLDRTIESDGLPGYAQHPKSDAMTTKGFRTIAEILHARFTKACGDLPEVHRVLDKILYTSEHYIWTVGKQFIVLKAYDGNDNDGLVISVTSKSDGVELVRKMHRSKQSVFKDWGQPLPGRTN